MKLRLLYLISSLKNYHKSDSENNEDEIFSIRIKSSDSINNYERTYITIFEIIGQIGGLSKFIIINNHF